MKPRASAGALPSALADEYVVDRGVRAPKGQDDVPCGGSPACRVCGTVDAVQGACTDNLACNGEQAPVRERPSHRPPVSHGRKSAWQQIRPGRRSHQSTGAAS
jgi:hypothetical protein